MEGMIGEVRMFAGNFAPKNWSFCNGNIINIASNTALFSILGTTYGGNGTTTFALPNTISRSVVGVGTGSGLSTYTLGEITGTPTETVSQQEMAAHTHAPTLSLTASVQLGASNLPADKPTPVGNYPAVISAANTFSYSADNPTARMMSSTLTITGNVTALPNGGSRHTTTCNLIWA